MKISDNFSRSEFQCGCCDKATVDVSLVEVLERCRSHFVKARPDLKISISITSGHRCADHNKAVKGARSSRHLDGLAADFVVRGVNADDVADWLESNYPDRFGIGRYTGRTHLDTRSDGPARWDYRGK